MDLLKPINNFINFDSPFRDSINITQKIHGDDKLVLGRGAYGTVIRASYKKQQVAVKILEKSNCTKYQSLRRESNILDLHHENVIGVLKIVDCRAYGAVIMQRFEGKCLQYILDRDMIDLIHRLNILSDIARALMFCHENRIVHADVKPQNVLVAVAPGRGYLCKLFDFGCSVKVDTVEDDPYEQVGGTIRYSAPEVLQNMKPDFSADVFSLAIIMWQMKENQVPYGDLPNETVMWNVVKNDMRPDSHWRNFTEFHGKQNSMGAQAAKEVCSKSESSFLQVKKFIDLPLTPKTYNRNIERLPKILIGKPSVVIERSTFGSLQKNRILKGKKPILKRKQLFHSKLSPSIEIEDNVPATDLDMKDLFIDQQLGLRSSESILQVESEYIKIYTDCWHRDKHQRYEICKVLNVLQNLIRSL